MPRLWANLILKVNRAQLKKRKIRKFKDMLGGASYGSEAEFKKISPDELKNIKSQIRKEASEEYRNEIIRYLFALIATILIIWLIISVVF